VNCNPHRHLKSPLSKPYHLLDKGKTTFPEKSKYDMDNPAVTKTMPTIFILPDMPGGMPSLRRTCLPAQTMHESSQFTVSFIPFSCYTIHEDISTLQSTAW
jgi:hypothetical protein